MRYFSINCRYRRARELRGERGGLLASLVEHTGSNTLAIQEPSLSTQVGSFSPEPGANWSKSAAQIASMARAAYRALSGALTLTSVQSTVHPLNETDGSLTLGNLAFTASVKRALANDVTVCGENEPVAFVTEYFLGDGVTTQFDSRRGSILSPQHRRPRSSTNCLTNR